MLNRTLLPCLALLSCFFVPPSASAYTWPDPQTDVLEAIYYQQNGYGGRRFGTFVRTCDEGANLGPGRTNSAEWVRTAYHDMATADVEAGTGGIDASIGFETLRPENVGFAAFSASLLKLMMGQTNIDSKQPFDDTLSALDNNIATQFLDNNTQNALAFGPNETTQSDFCIFSSDGGALMRKLPVAPS
ncbi:hypothetical protein C8A00DRAFT_29723 [Chaetomidium leptoderma]|uniref:Peroxidase n=1 Tax=Chaetomidium leptoderma TaxID=669021 RepID=A0AAN7A0T9_9PEZI|nr:hypothetical protein C8A00DRAFT_29723 [Chaetomidium leptoderma]